MKPAGEKAAARTAAIRAFHEAQDAGDLAAEGSTAGHEYHRIRGIGSGR